MFVNSVGNIGLSSQLSQICLIDKTTSDALAVVSVCFKGATGVTIPFKELHRTVLL